MEPFVLSDDRQAELGALLADEARFAASYPVVADYLGTAPLLSGTGNDADDHAFDLRLLHYMTGGESHNPYWDIVGPSVAPGPPERRGRREVNGGKPEGSARLAYAQTALQATYAYAIPSPDTISWVVDACEGRPVLEIGAGRGYWAHQLARAGADIVAHDSHPPGTDDNPCFPDAAGQRTVWHPVRHVHDLTEPIDAGMPGQVLFLCWPPAWRDPMASSALRAYEAAGGDRVIYVGEHKGGKSGDDAFFDALASGWKLATTDAMFVSWWNLHDVAECWVRA